MASTTTYTGSRTFPRLSLLKLQVLAALGRTTPLRKGDRTALDKGLDNRWIEAVNIFGTDRNGLSHAKLTVRIDWERYQLEIDLGNTIVTIDDRWRGDTAVELEEATRLFCQYAGEMRLRTIWTIGLRRGLDVDAICKALGFVKGYEPRSAGVYLSARFVNMQMPELTTELYLVED